MSSSAKLLLVKLVHTLAWAVFASCIVLIPVFAVAGWFEAAAWLIAIVMGEVAVLVANRMRCPLTGVAARYTHDRRDNFDIFLPLWVARYNKEIFGTLYVLGILVTLGLWLAR